MGYPVTETGFILAPRGFGTLISMFVVGRIVGTEHFRNIERHGVETLPGVLFVRVDESIFFGNLRAIESRLLAELAKRSTPGVSALEVNDYAPGHYTGALTPSPPHADMNPKKAVIVSWKGRGERFIFSHEASYCPLLELPSGAAMCNQFFEGNLGDAELLNNPGRKERNSFVDIVQSGPQRVWVRWNYFCVNMNDDTQPRLRGTEDYFAYPNGLVMRRMSYVSMMPEQVVGYSTDPVELFGVAPVGATIKDLFPRDAEKGDYLTHTVIDLYSDKRYDIFWDENGGVRRNGPRGDAGQRARRGRGPARNCGR